MTVEVGFNARIDAFRAQVKQIPGITRREVNTAVNAAGQAWKRMPRDARRAAQQARRQVDQVTSSLSRISPAAGAATESIRALGAALGPGMAAAAGPLALAAAGIAAIGGAGFAAASQMSRFVDQMGILAESTGISQRTVIALRSAVRASGGDFNKTQEALARFTKTMDLTGRSAEQVDAALMATIERIDAIDSPAERAAERMRIFGTRSSSAIAALSGPAMREAMDRTEALSKAVDDAAGASAAWDRATGELADQWELFTVKAGTVWAESLLGLSDLVGSAHQATDGWLQTIAELVPAYVVFATALGDTDPLDRWTAWVTGSQAAMRESMRLRNDLEIQLGTGGRSPALDPTEGMVSWEEIAEAGARQRKKLAQEEAEAAKKAREERAAAAIEAARAEAEKVAEARKAVQDADRRDAFTAMVQENEERAQIAAQGAQMLRQIEEQEHEQKIARLQEQMDKERELAEFRRWAAREAVDNAIGAAGAIAEASGIIGDARAAEALAYQAVAIGRAFADLGPIAGFAALPSIIAPISRALRAAGSSRGAGVAPGGGAPAGPARGFSSTDRAGAAMVVEYRGEIYDAQTRDAARRPGSPLRGIIRQRRVAR